jgi:hypothetical protein
VNCDNPVARQLVIYQMKTVQCDNCDKSVTIDDGVRRLGRFHVALNSQ